jgi:large repetitive protein
MKYKLLLFFLLASFFSFSQENCNNGIDDDNDGLIDLNDPNCVCNNSAITSIIPNPSFETKSSCPSSFSELYLATPWIQATTATTDYYNKCGFIMEGITTMGLQNFPNGDAIAGALFLRDWNEYLGATLNAPMTVGTSYQLTFNIAGLVVNDYGIANPTVNITSFEPVNITIYGCANGSNLPLNTVFNPTDDTTWIEIGSATYTPSSVWGEITMIFTPTFTVNAIMIGAPKVLPASYPLGNTGIFPYFIYDNLLLNTAATFGVNITQSGNYCDNNLVLTANVTTPVSNGATYQWYKNGIAISGANNISYNVPAFVTSLGQYSVKVTNAGACYVSTKITINNTIASPSATSVQPNCVTVTGSITITTPGSQYSFDNGVTWQTSPTKSLLAIGVYYVKIKTPTGCVSSSTGVSIIEPQLLAGSDYTVVQPTTCDGFGSVTINAANAAQYSFDDGATWTTNATANNLAPGYYYLKIKDASGCQSAAQFVNIIRVFLSDPSYSVVQPSCGIQGSISITTTATQYSFDDGVTWTSNPTASNLPAGYYSIKIKNSTNCESNTVFVSLDTFYLNITPTFTVVQPTCGTGGSITITTAGSQFSFDGGVTWSTNATASNLEPNYYSIVIKNNLGCISQSTYAVLDAFYLPNPTFTFTQPSCGLGGSITLTSSESQYSFDGGVTWSTNATASNLQPGTYYIMIKNSLGCTSNFQYVNLDYFYLPNPTFNVVNPSCGNIGSITITTPAAQYSFDGGTTWTTNPVANNLQSGYYYIKIKNTLGCESSYIYVYLDATYLATPNYIVTQPTCNVGGSISITTVAAQYSFNGGNTWTTNPVSTNLSAGDYYYIMIKNAAGCTSSNSYVYMEPFYLAEPTFTIVQPACASLGKITITTTATQYSFDGGYTWTTNPVLSNITSGYFSIQIKNNLGCVSYPKYVNLDQFYLPDPVFSITQPTCETGGIISISTIADQYSFDNGATWTTNPIKTYIPFGYHYIKIKNALGCESNSVYAYLEQSFLPDPTYTVVQPTCTTAGSITITTTAYQYSFDNGATWTTNAVATNLIANNTYYILIKNASGCVSNYQYVSIYPAYLPNPTFITTQPTCAEGGTIQITTTADFYSFDNGNTWTTNPIALNLQPNYYYVKIKNSAGCQSEYQYAYIGSGGYIPNAPTFTFINPTGCGSTNGTITITSSGNSFSFDNGVTWVSNPVKNLLADGTYLIRVKQSGSNCPSNAVTVILNSSITATPAPTYTVLQPTCAIVSGTINITTVASEYSFDNGVTWLTTNSLSGLASGTYVVKIKNSSGCISIASTVIINPITIPLAPNATAVQPLCGVGGSITISTNAFQYSFDNGLTWSSNNIAPNLTAGTYQIKIKNSTSGCPSLATPITITTATNAPAAPTALAVQPTTCSNAFGSIAITSIAFQYSFDNGATYSTNATSLALPPGTYSVKVKNSDNCESSAVSVTINAPLDYPTLPTFTILQPDCNNLKGKITITSSANEYSFDNGLTWSTSNISPFLIPNSYNLKVKNTLGCVSNLSVATIIPFTNFTNPPTLMTPQYFCIQNTNTINSISITGQNVKWYDAPTNGNLLSNTTLLQDGLTYYASQTINNCESLRVPIIIQIQNTNAPTANLNQSFCTTQNATLNDIVITGTVIKWYANSASTSTLPTTTVLLDGITYYATQTVNGCESITRQAVTITLINTLNATDYSDFKCDDLNNGFVNIDLTSYASNLISNTTNCTFSYYQTSAGAINQTVSELISITNPYNLLVGTKTIYVRITSINTCYQLVELKLTLYPKPLVSIKDIEPICENQNITVDAGAGFDNYTWSTGVTNQQSIVVSQPGSYSVTVTKNNGAITCTATKNFEVVKSNKATIKNIETVDWSATENTILVNLTSTSVGDYEYSLDGINYQNSPIFNNLNYGLYTIYVKDKNGCGIADGEVYLMMHPKFFTPNGDGFNDLWKIEFSEIEPNLNIKIIDRYGKFLKQLNGLSLGWDGTYNGVSLPADDYWFVVTRENGKEYKGHFALKR